MKGYTKEQANRLINDNPIFAKDIKAFLVGADIPQELLERVPQNVRDSLGTLVEIMLTTTAFRDLYDFFDPRGIRVEVFMTTVGFDATIMDVTGPVGSVIEYEEGSKETRTETELAAFMVAIEAYESIHNKLTI